MVDTQGSPKTGFKGRFRSHNQVKRRMGTKMRNLSARETGTDRQTNVLAFLPRAV